MLDEDTPSKEQLEYLVSLGLSDQEISIRLTGGSRLAWWSKVQRLKLGVHRPRGGAGQVATAIIHPIFLTGTERDEWFDRVRHGDITIEDVCSFTGCTYSEVDWEYRQWIARNTDRPSESRAMRQARDILTDHDTDLVDKIKALFGRRLVFKDYQGTRLFFLDGEKLSLRQLIEEADTEASELGLPQISKKVRQ